MEGSSGRHSQYPTPNARSPPQGPQHRVSMAGSHHGVPNTMSPVPHPFSRVLIAGGGVDVSLGSPSRDPHRSPPTSPGGIPGSPGAAVTPVGTPGPSIPTPLPPQRSSGEGCLLKPKRTNPCAYTPPSLKGTTRGGKGGTGVPGGTTRCSRCPVTLASPQRCSASCSPTWRVAWAGVTAPTGSPTTAVTPTVPSSLVRGTGDTGTGLPEPRRFRDRGARAWGTQGRGEGDSGARRVWGWGCWSLGHGDRGLPEPGVQGDMGTQRQGCQSPEDVGTSGEGFWSPDNTGLELLEPGGHGEMLEQGRGSSSPVALGGGVGTRTGCCRCCLSLLPVLLVPAAHSPAGEATTFPRRAVSPSPAGPGDASRTPGRCLTRHCPVPRGRACLAVPRPHRPPPGQPRGARAEPSAATSPPGSRRTNGKVTGWGRDEDGGERGWQEDGGGDGWGWG